MQVPEGGKTPEQPSVSASKATSGEKQDPGMGIVVNVDTSPAATAANDRATSAFASSANHGNGRARKGGREWEAAESWRGRGRREAFA
eukprot:CAMPEP_0177251302 /NCGR_PEP_ID=MMETSP0367-20130122/53885_1 /TAXON_ID=447022 ORGANISM="Scrippsiella hangoei-like, Strain SHHI-4" /NCGR_SAMPLE_ID=MMETSP0367 /ASSEMBLY_ACC=CAM_ASM_000362 /LENGTH=87 /DNA_ID=CAMNT_0018704209 /DNA_START=399 /DNA_END=658 /DNA_ORIENTATION=-